MASDGLGIVTEIGKADTRHLDNKKFIIILK
jgi:hypothetical protein